MSEPAPNLELHRITGRGQDAWSVDEIWALGGHAAAGAGDIAGVLAFAEPHVVAAALVADRLGLPGPSLQASILSRSKALQRACFAAHRMPQPEFTHVVGRTGRFCCWRTSTTDPYRLDGIITRLLRAG